MLVSLKEVIDLAEKGNFAIPAFNVYNTETINFLKERGVNV